MSPSSPIRWGRVLIGGVAAELVLFVAVIPFYLLGGEPVLVYPALVGSLVLPYAATLWVVRPLEDRFVAHGVLVGIVGVVFYTALTFGQPLPVLYVVAHVLKLVGGGAAGLVAGRRRSAARTETAA